MWAASNVTKQLRLHLSIQIGATCFSIVSGTFDLLSLQPAMKNQISEKATFTIHEMFEVALILGCCFVFNDLIKLLLIKANPSVTDLRMKPQKIFLKDLLNLECL